MSLTSFFTDPKNCTGIELCFTPSKTRVFISNLTVKKGEVVLLDNLEIAFDELSGFIKKQNQPYMLCVTGKGLLFQDKQTEFTEDFVSESNYESQVIIRKDSIPALINELSLSHMFAGLTLGTNILKEFAEQLSLENISSYCYTNHHDVKPNWDLEEVEHNISGQLIGSSYLCSYLSGLSILTKKSSSVSALELRAEDFYYNHMIKKGVIATGVVVLVLLMINFFVWDNYSGKVSELSLRRGVSSKYSNEYKKLEQEMELKTKYYNKLGYNRTQMLTYYTDEIGYSVPKSMTLSELEVYPINDDVLKKQKLYEFDQSSIHLSGACSEIVEFNNWVDQLKNMPWVKDLKVENYQYDNSSRLSVFNLNIGLK